MGQFICHRLLLNFLTSLGHFCDIRYFSSFCSKENADNCDSFFGKRLFLGKR